MDAKLLALTLDLQKKAKQMTLSGNIDMQFYALDILDYLGAKIDKAKENIMPEIGDEMLDGNKNHYTVLAIREERNQNTHSQKMVSTFYKVEDKRRGKIRWVSDITVKSMLDDGNLKIL